MNTRLLQTDEREGIGYFTKEVLQRLTAAHPDHRFHFFFDRPFDASLLFSPNVEGHVLPPPARHPGLWKIWFDVQVPRRLKKIGADVFLSPDGQCSLTTRVPQCLVVHDLAFLHHPEGYRKSHQWYYRRFTPAFVRRARTVLTVSAYSQADICAQYKTAAGKTAVVPNGVRESFVPLEAAAQQAVKDQYTGGADYFCYAGAIQPRKNLVNLLKAFSVFKRRLQSGFKLVLAGRLAWKNEEFLHLLKTFKYRDEVVLTGYLPESELARVMASAYAFVYPSLWEGFGLPVAEAMRCRVPVLTSRDSAMAEVTDGAALYFDPKSVDDMADKLMRIYKDEDGRRVLIDRGSVVVQRYHWSHTADAVWKALERTAGSSTLNQKA